MRLSDHFTLDELTVTKTGLKNDPPAEVVERLQKLCLNVLEPVRHRFGRPVVVNSGYRSPLVNRKVGGATKSQHVGGYAADIEIPGVSNGEVAAYIRNNLDFDQVILEAYTPGQPSSGWVHVSYVEGRYRRSVLTWIPGRGYLRGLVL